MVEVKMFTNWQSLLGCGNQPGSFKPHESEHSTLPYKSEGGVVSDKTPTTPHEHAEVLARRVKELQKNKSNEADTRYQIINEVLHKVLSWPISAVQCESYIDPGFSDYILLGRRNRQLLFIEAKKAGKYFAIPPSFGGKDTFRFVKVKTLMTDSSIAKAMGQVREYCTNMGCEHAAITNGSQWIFFRTFLRGQDWRSLQGFVIENLDFFTLHFTKALEMFSYRSITEKASLANLFEDSKKDDRPRYFPKEKIIGYDHEVTSNDLASAMRPLIERYFTKMSAQDRDFMDRCYVNSRDYSMSATNVKQLIHDSLSPYFRNYKVKDFHDERDGGAFGSRISDSVQNRRTRDVIVLFGGKGSGKSTFTNRLLYHRPPHPIKHFAHITIVDLIECPDSQIRIEEELWTQLIRELDTDKVLDESRESLLSLFLDRYQIAQKQILSGLSVESEAYNVKLNSLVEEWKKDKVYCAKRLAQYWKSKHQGIIIAVDNTDQFSPLNQDYCFTSANFIATELNCLVVISMREERFHYSKIHGTLDAFHNSGFHLSSPDPAKLFILRLMYLLEILQDKQKMEVLAPDLSAKEISDFITLASIFLNEFRSSSSHLKKFIKACAHGNMRLALDFFRQFALSGYLQIREMIAKPAWTLQVHQVLRPMMVPYRLFYDERKSSVPNIYQIRSEENGSHFTGLRILKILSHNKSTTSQDYIPLSKVRGYFVDNFNMLDDVEKNLDVFLKGGVVESNNRIDEYNDSIDSIKVTAYGLYIKENLAHNFAYLDLVSLDCGVHDQGVADSLALLGNNDRTFFLDGRKRDRMNSRIDKVRTFLDYLRAEEQFEREYYNLEDVEEEILTGITKGYKADETRVLKSARKNI